MTQNASKQHASPVSVSVSSLPARIKKTFLGGASIVALSVPMMSQDAAAEGWQYTSQYYPGGYTAVLRRISGSPRQMVQLNNPAPGNNCPVPAFEVLNPGRGEARCVGYVVPSWLTR